jgi:Gas vesicle protein
MPQIVHPTDGTTLADLLERILDKGLVIAGDIRIRLVEVELLTINIRLLIASVDKAREIGIDWWTRSSFLCSQVRPELPGPSADALESELRELRSRLDRLEHSS